MAPKRKAAQASQRSPRQTRQRGLEQANPAAHGLFDLPDPEAIMKRARTTQRARLNNTADASRPEETPQTPSSRQSPRPRQTSRRQQSSSPRQTLSRRQHSSPRQTPSRRDHGNPSTSPRRERVSGRLTPTPNTPPREASSPRSVQPRDAHDPYALTGVSANLLKHEAPSVTPNAIANRRGAAEAWGADGSLRSVLIDKMDSTPVEFEVNPAWEWIKGGVIGQGGQGTAYLWGQVDKDGNLLDSMVIKDTAIIMEIYNHVDAWWPQSRDPDRVPIEVAAMSLIEDRQDELDNPPCSSIRGWQLFLKEHYYKLFMDFYPLGNLQDTLDRFYQGVGQDPIPEPVIWAILDSLTDACFYMAYGGRHKDGAPAGWQEIVHRDIKYANIFLRQKRNKASKETTFPSIPQTVLGDFGLSVLTSEDDIINPAAFLNAGTNGWDSPETIGWYNVKSLATVDYKMGEKTNIWGIGAVALRLMSRSEMHAQSVEDKALRLGYPAWDVSEGQDFEMPRRVQENYSPELVQLVHSCCKFKPEERLELDRLRHIIELYTAGSVGADEPDLAERARHELQEHTLRTEESTMLQRFAPDG